MTLLYFLAQNHLMYSVYADQRTLVVSSTDRASMIHLQHTIENHYRTRGRWLNAFETYTSRKRDYRDAHALTIRESTAGYSAHMDNAWTLVELDLQTNTSDANLVDLLYECANARFFLVERFALSEDHVLSLHGVILDKPSETSRFDCVAEYLEALVRNVDSEEDSA